MIAIIGMPVKDALTSTAVNNAMRKHRDMNSTLLKNIIVERLTMISDMNRKLSGGQETMSIIGDFHESNHPCK